MKYILLVICIASSLLAQKIYLENEVIKKNNMWFDSKTLELANGIVKIYDENRILRQERPLINGEFTGVLKYYYPNGVLQQEIPLVRNIKQGTKKIYHDNGNLKETIEYGNNKLNGYWKSYHYFGGLKTEYEFKNDDLCGLHKEFYTNGNLKFSNVVGDSGLSKDFYENGNLKAIHPIKNGKINGIVIFFYLNGNIKSETEYIDNKKNGLEKIYTKTGKLDKEIVYKNDKIIESTTYKNESKKTYDCKVLEISGLSEQEEKDFRMKNGKVKDGDIYRIVFNEQHIDFLNKSNGASMIMREGGGIASNPNKTYKSNMGHFLEFDEKTNAFTLFVLKTNFSANFSGYCEYVE